MKRATVTTRRHGVSALLRVAKTSAPDAPRDVDQSRQLVANFCRLMLGERQLTEASPRPSVTPSKPLTRRVQQTLTLLLQGEGEKQIARCLNLSPHTVHVYVKTLYKSFDVCTRSELMARFVDAPPARSQLTVNMAQRQQET